MANVSWSRKPNIIDPNEKLLVFGYSCKIFRDEEKSHYIDNEAHMIPWMGNESLMIDRYDVRGYLHDLSEYEPKAGGYDDPLAEEESLCDEERYRSLRSDVSEEQLYQEEELKRLRAAIAGDGAYHEIAFSYDNADNEPSGCEEGLKVEEPEDEPYELPEGLRVPKGMELPSTMKIHAIIEKTANFVSQQGGQMEIIIKMKQQSNPQFAFMHLDNPLYPYYKHLVKEIKSEAYKPTETKKESISPSEDEDDDHYLHPSLMSGKQEQVPKFTVPTINFRRTSDDSYSVLVRNLQQQQRDSPSDSPQQQIENEENVAHDNGNESNMPGYFGQEVQPPPPDLQPIIDKMAEYVAKNGEDFETIVKSKNDTRFDFLQPWHEYYHYYLYKRNVTKALMVDSKFPKIENDAAHHAPQNSHYTYMQDNSAYVQAVQNPVVRESGPVLYSQNQVTCQPEPAQQVFVPSVPTKDEFDDLYAQDPEDGVSSAEQPPSALQLCQNDDTSDSMDFLDSPKVESPKSDPKLKPLKHLKGSISFSLKPRDMENPSEKVPPVLLCDSEEDEEVDGTKGKAGTAKDEEKRTKQKRPADESYQSRYTTDSFVETDSKASKSNNEVMEAKIAEERKKDKLLATTRERLAQQKKESQLLLEQQKREEQQRKEKQQQIDQQRKEKQLQLERKRKAELFLKMLRKKNPDPSAVVSHILASSGDTKSNSSNPSKGSDFWNTPNPTGIVFHGDKMFASSHNKSEWSSDSCSQHSGELEPISFLGEKLSSDPEEEQPPRQQSLPKPEKKKKKKKRERSRSRERRSSRSRDSRRRRSRSHRRDDRAKKELPAAYALIPRSRSRSRSPRRYRPPFNHWIRRR